MKKVKTSAKGVRYREHPTRKHGINFDRYYFIRYRVDSKQVEEGLGWASEGWTLTKAVDTLSELKRNSRIGEGEKSLREKREAAKAAKQAEEAEKKRIEMERAEFEKAEAERIRLEQETLFVTVFQKYCESNSHKKSLKYEITFVRLWVEPVVRGKRLQEITAFDIERIKRNMTRAGRAVRSIQYIFAIIRQIFNYAKARNLFDGESPTKGVNLPKFDNRRIRFLSPGEADSLLNELRQRSPVVYYISMLSLYTGARLGEITKLLWQHIDMENHQITFVDTKNRESRRAFMPEAVFQMFLEMTPGKPNELVFPSKTKEEIEFLSKTFKRAVDKLGFNEGVTDRRMKVVFHTLRHSAASQLAMKGVDLPTIGAILGHKTLAMTARYSHLSNEHVKNALGRLEDVWNQNRAEVIPMKKGDS